MAKVVAVCDAFRFGRRCLAPLCKKHVHRHGNKDFCPDCAPKGTEESKGD